MEIDSSFITTPKYFNMLVSATGQLSGDERLNRIKRIGKYNPWLAARCINTCVREEIEAEDWLILRCVSLYEKFEDIQSLAALFELHEYAIICDILNPSLNPLIRKKKILNNNKLLTWVINDYSISEAFAIMSNRMTIDLSNIVFKRLIDLGYSMNVDAYNSILSRTKNDKERESIMQEMESSGVDADAQTYGLLIANSNNYQEAYNHFISFKQVVDSSFNSHLLNGVFSKLFNLTINVEDTIKIYEEYLEFHPNLDFCNTAISHYYRKMIVFCKSTYNANLIFSDFENKYLIPLIQSSTQKLSNRKGGKLLKMVICSYIQFLAESIDDNSSLISYLITIFNKYSKVLEFNISYAIIERINKYQDFENSKNLIDTLTNNGIQIDKKVYVTLFNYIQKWEDIYYVLNTITPESINPKLICTSINVLKKDNEIKQMICLLKEKNYVINSYIYNAMIKKSSLKQAIEIINNMKEEGVSPDYYSIQPLFYKWISIDEFERIVLFVEQFKIDADDKMINCILNRIIYLCIQEQFLESYFIMKSDFTYSLNKSWKKTISNIINNLIQGELLKS